MTRKLVVVLLLALAVAAAALTVVAMRDVAETYADPHGGAFSTLGDFGILVVAGMLLVAALGGIAAAVAPAGGRRGVAVVVAGLVVATLAGALVAERLGVETKRVQAAQPSGCGIANPALDAQFREIDHPGYFGGGMESRTSCSYAVFVSDVQAALGEYDEVLLGLGYHVVATGRGLTATRAASELTVEVRRPRGSDPFLQVSLHAVQPSPVAQTSGSVGGDL